MEGRVLNPPAEQARARSKTHLLRQRQPRRPRTSMILQAAIRPSAMRTRLTAVRAPQPSEDGRLLVANLIVARVSPGDFRLGGNEVRAGYKKS